MGLTRRVVEIRRGPVREQNTISPSLFEEFERTMEGVSVADIIVKAAEGHEGVPRQRSPDGRRTRALEALLAKGGWDPNDFRTRLFDCFRGVVEERKAQPYGAVPLQSSPSATSSSFASLSLPLPPPPPGGPPSRVTVELKESSDVSQLDFIPPPPPGPPPLLSLPTTASFCQARSGQGLLPLPTPSVSPICFDSSAPSLSVFLSSISSLSSSSSLSSLSSISSVSSISSESSSYSASFSDISSSSSLEVLSSTSGDSSVSSESILLSSSSSSLSLSSSLPSLLVPSTEISNAVTSTYLADKDPRKRAQNTLIALVDTPAPASSIENDIAAIASKWGVIQNTIVEIQAEDCGFQDPSLEYESVQPVNDEDNDKDELLALAFSSSSAAAAAAAAAAPSTKRKNAAYSSHSSLKKKKKKPILRHHIVDEEGVEDDNESSSMENKVDDSAHQVQKGENSSEVILGEVEEGEVEEEEGEVKEKEVEEGEVEEGDVEEGEEEEVQEVEVEEVQEEEDNNGDFDMVDSEIFRLASALLPQVSDLLTTNSPPSSPEVMLLSPASPPSLPLPPPDIDRSFSLDASTATAADFRAAARRMFAQRETMERKRASSCYHTSSSSSSSSTRLSRLNDAEFDEFLTSLTQQVVASSAVSSSASSASASASSKSASTSSSNLPKKALAARKTKPAPATVAAALNTLPLVRPPTPACIRAPIPLIRPPSSVSNSLSQSSGGCSVTKSSFRTVSKYQSTGSMNLVSVHNRIARRLGLSSGKPASSAPKTSSSSGTKTRTIKRKPFQVHQGSKKQRIESVLRRMGGSCASTTGSARLALSAVASTVAPIPHPASHVTSSISSSSSSHSSSPVVPSSSSSRISSVASSTASSSCASPSAVSSSSSGITLVSHIDRQKQKDISSLSFASQNQSLSTFSSTSSVSKPTSSLSPTNAIAFSTSSKDKPFILLPAKSSPVALASTVSAVVTSLSSVKKVNVLPSVAVSSKSDTASTTVSITSCSSAATASTSPVANFISIKTSRAPSCASSSTAPEALGSLSHQVTSRKPSIAKPGLTPTMSSSSSQLSSSSSSTIFQSSILPSQVSSSESRPSQTVDQPISSIRANEVTLAYSQTVAKPPIQTVAHNTLAKVNGTFLAQTPKTASLPLSASSQSPRIPSNNKVVVEEEVRVKLEPLDDDKLQKQTAKEVPQVESIKGTTGGTMQESNLPTFMDLGSVRRNVDPAQHLDTFLAVNINRSLDVDDPVPVRVRSAVRPASRPIVRPSTSSAAVDSSGVAAVTSQQIVSSCTVATQAPSLIISSPSTSATVATSRLAEQFKTKHTKTSPAPTTTALNVPTFLPQTSTAHTSVAHETITSASSSISTTNAYSSTSSIVIPTGSHNSVSEAVSSNNERQKTSWKCMEGCGVISEGMSEFGTHLSSAHKLPLLTINLAPLGLGLCSFCGKVYAAGRGMQVHTNKCVSLKQLPPEKIDNRQCWVWRVMNRQWFKGTACLTKENDVPPCYNIKYTDGSFKKELRHFVSFLNPDAAFKLPVSRSESSTSSSTLTCVSSNTHSSSSSSAPSSLSNTSQHLGRVGKRANAKSASSSSASISTSTKAVSSNSAPISSVAIASNSPIDPMEAALRAAAAGPVSGQVNVLPGNGGWRPAIPERQRFANAVRARCPDQNPLYIVGIEKLLYDHAKGDYGVYGAWTRQLLSGCVNGCLPKRMPWQV